MSVPARTLTHNACMRVRMYACTHTHICHPHTDRDTHMTTSAHTHKYTRGRERPRLTPPTNSSTTSRFRCNAAELAARRSGGGGG
eukprot:2858815-Rhodomonas_salina.3